jgi:hypothetical protein
MELPSSYRMYIRPVEEFHHRVPGMWLPVAGAVSATMAFA